MPVRSRNLSALCLRVLSSLPLYPFVYRTVFRVAHYTRTKSIRGLVGCLILTCVTALLWVLLYFAIIGLWRLVH